MTDLPIPQNIRDFSRMFATEEQCAEYLFKLRWPDGYRCPTLGCGEEKAWKVDDLWTMHCRNNHKITVTAGTSLHRSKQPLATWFHAAWLVSTLTPGISAVQFQKQLGLKRYETAFQLLHKLRAALVAPDREPLKGHVETDEAFITRKDETMSTILGAVEVIIYEDKNGKGETVLLERAGRIRLKKVPDKSADSILPFITENVATDTDLYTDGSITYRALNEMGYRVHAHVQGKGKDAVYTNHHLHRLFSNVKTWLKGTHHSAVTGKHLQAYLNEYVYRHNRRFFSFSGFMRSLILATHTGEHPEYETLYRAGEEGGWVHPNPKPPTEEIDDMANSIFDDLCKHAPPLLLDWIGAHGDEVQGQIRSVTEQVSL